MAGRVNRKLLRMYEGNTRKIPDHLHHFWDDAERTVVKEGGTMYRRPHAMHMHTLASHRCIVAFRRAR